MNAASHNGLSIYLRQQTSQLYRIVSVFCFVGPLLLTSALAHAQDLHPFIDPWGQTDANYGYSRSTKPIEIELWNPSTSIHLTIAKAYLTFKPNWSGGRQDFVVLEAALPDLNPVVLDSREMVAAEDRVFVRLRASIRGGTPQFAKRVLSRLRKSSEDEEFAWYHEKSVFDSFGVPHVKPDDDEFAVPLEQVGNPQVLFDCLLPAPNRKVGCKVYNEVAATDAATVGLNYQIRRSELKRWREIDSAVRKLVTSFELR